MLAMTSVVSTYYLTFYRTYDDIVSQGAFLVLLPLVSVIPMALSNIVVGIVLGKTRTVQGKASHPHGWAPSALLRRGHVRYPLPLYWIPYGMDGHYLQSVCSPGQSSVF